MSAGREVNAANPSAREKAIRTAEDHWPDGTKRHILITLARLIRGDDCLIWPSAAWVAWRTGLGEPSIERAFAEFRKRGILQPTGKTIGQGAPSSTTLTSTALQRPIRLPNLGKKSKRETV